jgi:hypothetical protein
MIIATLRWDSCVPEKEAISDGYSDLRRIQPQFSELGMVLETEAEESPAQAT